MRKTIDLPKYSNLYRPSGFRIEELVPKSIYRHRGDKAWELLDIRLVWLVDCFKMWLENKKAKKIPFTINNWLWKGSRNWSGFRTVGYKGYSPTSQHSLGRAFDILVKGFPIREVQELLEEFVNTYFEEIQELHLQVTIEMGSSVTWLHIDSRPNISGKLFNVFYVSFN